MRKVYATGVSAKFAGSIRVNVYKLLILVGRNEFQMIGTRPIEKARKPFRKVASIEGQGCSIV